MKKVSLLFLLAFTSACGNHLYSDQPNSTRDEDVSAAKSGLVLTVKNSLPEEQIGSQRVRPHLNAYFCSPIPKNGPIPPQSERCFQLTGVIRNGTTETFLVTRAQLVDIYLAGNGYGAFEFSDSHQNTSGAWNCYIPNDKVKLDPNFDAKQTWQVEVNQRYALSYGCLVNRK